MNHTTRDDQPSAYRAAGVDIDAKYQAVTSAKEAIRATFTPGVVGDVGAFGGLFDLAAAGASGDLLVASTDGVGTKVKVAQRCGRLDGVGRDLVNHCVDDILVQGARPLFFMDYIAVDTMDPPAVATVIGGLAGACLENGMALLGGETAEMPGVYRPGEMDIAGTIVGAVPRARLLDGSAIAAADRVMVLQSSGLHTNGFSLARKIAFEDRGLDPDQVFDELNGARLADALLAVHRSYLQPVMPLLDAGLVHGMAHITGGGLYDNIPRVLPEGLGVDIERVAMPRPPIFDFLCAGGAVSAEEAYRVFNMGFGMVLFIDPDDADRAAALVATASDGEILYDVGVVNKVTGEARVVLR